MVVDKKSRYNIGYLKRQIDKYQYISFDMFDTLIKRNVSEPTDVFAIVELEYNKESKKPLHNWRPMRIEAESRARVESNNYEPNIDEIYDQVNLPDTEKKILKELELEWEVKICQQNVDFYPVYEYAKKHAKKIFVTSDMYLDAKTIKKILKDADITFDEIYLSNKKRANKRSGEIFHLIINDNNIEKNQLLHIGDSKRSDFWGAKRVGANAALIPKRINNLKYYKKYVPKTLIENIVISYINNNITRSSNVYYRIGFEILGVVLFGYAYWLKDQLRKRDIKTVFFLAREGALLKKVFDLVSDKKEFDTRYLYVSRRSTRCGMLTDIGRLEDVCERCVIKNNVDFETLWKDLGITDAKGNIDYRLMQEIGVSGADSIRNWDGFDKIKDRVQENASIELDNLAGYLRQEGFEGKIAISDIGWRGTMQKSLMEVAKKARIEVDIYGYYIGMILDDKELKSHKGRYGYLFQGGDRENKEIRGFVGLFESMFLADHGSTIKYSKTGKGYRPVLDEFEYTDEESAVWRKMQKGALDFVEGLRNILDCDNIVLNPEFVGYGLKKIGLAPSLGDTVLLGDISFLNTKITKIAKPDKLSVYAMNPKKLLKDMNDCRWKVGFLKRLGKIDIDYFWIYKIMAKKK